MNDLLSVINERFVYVSIIALLAILLVVRVLSDYRKRRVVKRRFDRGRKMEYKARDFLIRQGFRVVDEQVEYEHSYIVDGVEHSSLIVVDYVVSRKGKTYIVEVKSGSSATSINNSATRRQLLEYSFAIECDGIYLLDMEAEELRKVDFIPLESFRSRTWIIVVLMLAIAGVWLPWITAKMIVTLILVVVIMLRKFIFRS